MTLELVYFGSMVCYGVTVSLCYHLVLLFRATIRHAAFVTDAEDILFFIATGAIFFWVAYEKNYGILRWYAFLGAAIGCLAYRRTLGASLESFRKWLLQKYDKTVKIKRKSHSKGQVSVDEGSSPEHEKKKKQKKRS